MHKLDDLWIFQSPQTRWKVLLFASSYHREKSWISWKNVRSNFRLLSVSFFNWKVRFCIYSQLSCTLRYNNLFHLPKLFEILDETNGITYSRARFVNIATLLLVGPVASSSRHLLFRQAVAKLLSQEQTVNTLTRKFPWNGAKRDRAQQNGRLAVYSLHFRLSFGFRGSNDDARLMRIRERSERKHTPGRWPMSASIRSLFRLDKQTRGYLPCN